MILTVQDLLKRSSEMFPDKVALIDRGNGDEETTYAQLEEKSNQFASSLLESGMKKGDRVALLGFNSTPWVITRYGVAKAGCVNVPINYRLTGRELEYILDNAGAKAIFVDEKFIPVVKDLKVVQNSKLMFIVNGQTVPTGMISFKAFIDKGSKKNPGVDVSEQDEEMYLYTSGTTGRPKGAVLCHFNTKNVAITIMMSLDYRPNHIYTSDYPFFSSGGAQFSVLASLGAGQTMIINPFFDPARTLKTIEEKKVNIYFCVPAMLIFILNLPNLKDYNMSSLGDLLCGGGPLPFPILKKAKETYPWVRMCNIYGMTEGGPGGIYLADKYLFQKEGSVGWGKSFMGMELIIADAQQNPVKPGEIGECILRGASVMKEYHNDPEETKRSLRNGWFHTGDLAKIDEDGFIWLMDRLKDMIVRGGYNVYPAEIESVLFGHAGVREAAVIGIPHESLGEDIKAFIVKKEEAVTAEEIKEYCRKNLADFKVPRHIEFIKELPRNTAGKVLKYQLREMEKSKK